MGGISDGGYQSIHLVNLNENLQITGSETAIKINDRVRDLLAIDELSLVLGTTEINPGILIILKIYNSKIFKFLNFFYYLLLKNLYI